MTAERARYIVTNALIGGDFRHAFRQPGDSPTRRLDPDGITPAEHAYVMRLWLSLPGWASYSTALHMIARGEG
jgi:hypothetical protein